MKLIFLRHGASNDSDLNSVGVAQARRMAEKLKAEWSSAVLMSSRYSRAHDSAKEMATILGIDPAKVMLGSVAAEWKRPDDLMWSLKYHAGEAGRAIVVTHRPDVEKTYLYFRKEFGLEEDKPAFEVMTGFSVDTETKEIKLLSHAA